MVIRRKIDSNETGAYYAEETSIGVLGGAPVWKPLEPNSYSDFGGELTLLARNPINNGRQRKKGVITDLDASGGINQDFTQTNSRDLLQGVMFADIRDKVSYVIDGASGDLEVVAGAGLPTLTSTVLDFTTLGLVVGEWLFVGGDDAGDAFATDANNGFKRVSAIAANVLTFDRTDEAMVTEDGTGLTVRLHLAEVLKNEVGALIRKRSYQIERQLGAPDTDFPANIQAEYLVGAIANEFTLNVEQADKINFDLSFVAIDNEQRTSLEGVKAGTREALIESDAFNTSSDFEFLRLYLASSTVAVPVPLFAYVTDLTVMINNNLSPDKAVGVLGAFDVTAGTFEVGGEVTAYFNTVEAVRAVRNNADAALTIAVVKDNAGVILDVPLIALGNGRLNVEQDAPITLPLEMSAATAIKLNAAADYTAMWCFFDTLPDMAKTD